MPSDENICNVYKWVCILDIVYASVWTPPFVDGLLRCCNGFGFFEWNVNQYRNIRGMVFIFNLLDAIDNSLY